MNKYYIWGFPGIGKSKPVNSRLRIVDADCERFKFSIPEDIFNGLHSQKNVTWTQRNPAYPNNYWDYVHSVDADMVLLNCHIDLLKVLEGEKLLLVYPSTALKDEYLRRYMLRGDNNDYMAQIKELYKDSWETIPGNSDTILYLGGNESSTHEYISKALGKATIDTRTHGQTKGKSGSYSTNFQQNGRELLMPDEVRMLDNRYAILFIRGAKPVMDLKYELTEHPAIHHTVDGGGPPYIHHQERPKTWLSGDPLFVPEADETTENEKENPEYEEE